MKKELTPLEYFIDYFTPKPNECQIGIFKQLIGAKEQNKDLFLIKKEVNYENTYN